MKTPMTILFEKSGVDFTRPDVIRYLKMERDAIRHAWTNCEPEQNNITDEQETEFEKYWNITYGLTD